MYLEPYEVEKMLKMIRDNYSNACVMLECISPVWVKKQGVEKSISDTGATFKWGANSFDDMKDMVQGFTKIKDDNILRGMAHVNSLYPLVAWLPIMKKLTQKILIFEKK